MSRCAARRGFSLIELIVSIAIIGVLIGLMLPAVQAARSAARSADCQNRLRQHAMAWQEQRASMGRFAWSTTLGGKSNINVYMNQCPASGLEAFASLNGYPEQLTSNYLKVYSGTAVDEINFIPDGFFATYDLKLVLDGTAYTIALADALYDFNVRSPDGSDVVDHWAGRYPGPFELSHEHGSTGVPINALIRKDLAALPFAAKEIAFGSRHRGYVNVAFVDGHTASIADSIDSATWSALGTQAGAEPVYQNF